MSFFSNLHEYVSNSVAGLSLNPKRFSFSRSDSGNGSAGPASPRGSADAGAPPHAGFPRVVPSPGVEALPQSASAVASAGRRCSSLDAMPMTRHNRPGSFRRQQPAPAAPEPPQPDFCCRRPSWPDVDVQAVSGVHKMDGSYFEHLTGVTWEQESRRESARRDFKASFSEARPPPMDADAADDFLSSKERDQLYVEMLYTIANAVGAPVSADGHYKEELYLFGQEAFGVSSDHHYRMLHAAGEEKPPIIVLSVVVVEAEGLEAKDANGFSDPYCMLGIQPVSSSPGAPQAAPPMGSNRALSEGSGVSGSPGIGGSGGDRSHPELRKHHSFRLSFKRRDGGGGSVAGPPGSVGVSGVSGPGAVGRTHRDSLGSGAQLPAKFIRATSVRPHTLNPRWNEKFQFDIDDVSSDSLHLDIWDHDDESSVLEAVSKLNEVRGVRGLGRFFKQVCQSARQSSQDDFLGCVTVPLRDIPCTGLDAWFKLEARSHRSTVQGRIHLRMWLSTREDHGGSDDDNWEEMVRHERLYRVFVRHCYRNSTNGGGRNTVDGCMDLPVAARTILRQHAAQADLSELQRACASLTAHANAASPAPAVLNALRDLHRAWVAPAAPGDPPLTWEQQGWLADTFSKILERSLQQIRKHRQIFCGDYASALEPLLRCLSTIASMPAFSKCCPFNKEIRSEIVTALRKGTSEWFASLRNATCLPGEPERSLVCLCTALHVELEAGLEIYHPLFENINGINYFSMVYKQTDKLLADELCKYLNQHGNTTDSGRWALLEPELTAITGTLALYLELRDFGSLSTQLVGVNVGGNTGALDAHRQLHVSSHCHEWFEPAVARWLNAIKPRAMQRVRNAWRILRIISPSDVQNVDPRWVRHSTASVDVARLLDSLRQLWCALSWPIGPNTGAISLLGLLLDAAAACVSLHGDMARQKLDESGYYVRQGPFYVADDMCIAVNDMEYVCQCLNHIEQSLDPNIFEIMGSESIRGMVERSRATLETRIDETLGHCEPQMHDALRKYAFHLAWSPDSLPTPQAISPLLEYLHVHLLTLNKALLPNNFHRILQHIWEAVLSALNDQVDAGGTSGSDTPSNFWPRLSEALEMLGKWWSLAVVASGSTNPEMNVRTMSFMRLEQRLRYHRTDTESLIEAFHCQRLQDQFNAQQQPPGAYGTLAVRTYFNHDSLCVEVLHARDIIPLDPNGYSDPFVIIELLPRRLFSRCAEQQTHVHKRTLNPMFDECFEFSVTLDACRDPTAMLAFTVMDHDVLTANDFAGEAFLALNSIPGVADAGSSIDNFHGLKQIELVLMQQYEKYHPILQILETRPGDKMAADFVKKQKMRFAATT